MNRTLYTLVGGNFIELDDFEFEQLAIREAFRGRLSFYQDVTLAAEGFIISGAGAVLGGGNFTISPGFIAFKGEVYAVDAQVIPDNAAHIFFWDVDVTFDPAGTEDFEDASTQETYEVRKVKLFSSVAPAADIMPFDRLLPSDPSLTMNKLVIRKQFSDGLNTTGTPLLTTIVPIGAWDMDALASVQVPHPIVSIAKIRQVTAIIISDANFFVNPLDLFNGIDMDGGVNSVTQAPQVVLLRRKDAGSFDNTLYDGAQNRGFITITHEP